jgi:hypothetical protein
MNKIGRLWLSFGFLWLSACSSAYYGGLEQIGIAKRDIMVHRVEKARDIQEETKQQFSSALEQFSVATQFSGGDLEAIYNKLNDEYEDSQAQAERIAKQIADIEDVSEALFAEWEQEIEQYNSPSLKRSSRDQLSRTRQKYAQLITAMKKAESRLSPVLTVFKDQILYLKHNLNARAIASLKNELVTMETDVQALIQAMEDAINEADRFIQTLENP